MGRVASRTIVIEDTQYTSEEVEAAEKLRDPTHVRSYSEEEWRELLESASVRDRARRVLRRRPTISTTGSPAATAQARTPSACASCSRRWSSDDGSTWSDTKVILKARKSQK